MRAGSDLTIAPDSRHHAPRSKSKSRTAPDVGPLRDRLAANIRRQEATAADDRFKAAATGESLSRRRTEADKAVVYSITQYSRRKGDDFSIEQLTTDLDDLVRDTAFKVDGFRTMVEDGSFDVAFQPIVELETGRQQHFEALVRFGENKFDVSPYEFITFAEAIGLIHEFDLAMCRKVLLFLAGRSGRRAGCTVAVNLSADSLATPTFAASLETLLSEHSGVRDRLMFEITETVRISDLQSVNQSIQQLRWAGHKVCLDDFGAGAAAFQYLRTLDVDVVKIDGDYVKNAYATCKGKKFLKAMAGLLTELGISIIAEMVEDEKHLPMIRDCGILFGQGYLFGKPSTDFSDFWADG